MTIALNVKARAPGRFRRLVMLPIIAAGAAALAYALSEDIVTRSLREDATATALAWRSYFSSGIEGLEPVIHSGQLTPEQRDFLTSSAKVGRVFRFRLFDARGRLVLESDKAGALQVTAALRDHDAGAVQAIKFQRTVVDVFQNAESSGVPAVYAEAHMPLLTPDGEVLGLVEIHIDQSRITSLFRQALHGFALLLAALIATGLFGNSVLSSLRRKNAKVSSAAIPTGNAPKTEAKVESLTSHVIVPPAIPDAENLDDWLTRVTEEAAQGIPERIGLECHLGVGDATLHSEKEQLQQFVTELIAEAATALSISSEVSGNAIVLIPRIVVSSRFTRRGIEVSIADNRLQPLVDESVALRGLRQLALAQGGGLDVHERPGSATTFIAWWPDPLRQARAA